MGADRRDSYISCKVTIGEEIAVYWEKEWRNGLVMGLIFDLEMMDS